MRPREKNSNNGQDAFDRSLCKHISKEMHANKQRSLLKVITRLNLIRAKLTAGSELEAKNLALLMSRPLNELTKMEALQIQMAWKHKDTKGHSTVAMKHYRNNLNEIIQSYINSVREFEPLISASPKSARYRVFTRNIEEYIKTVNIAYSCLKKETDSKKIPACCVKLKTALHDETLLSQRAQHNNTLVSVELLRDTATMMLRVINENRHAFTTEKAPKSFSVGI